MLYKRVIGGHPIYIVLDIPRGSHQQVPANPPRQDPSASWTQHLGRTGVVSGGTGSQIIINN